MEKRNKIYWITSILFFFIIGCKKEQFHQEESQLKGNWVKNDTINFRFPIQDTTAFYNLHLKFTNNNNYPFSNVYLLSNFVNPKKQSIQDTLEYYIAFPDGTWYSNKEGGFYTRKLMFRDSIKLNQIGDYQLKLVHGMRKDTLNGIENIGIIVEKISNNETETNTK